MADLPTAVQDQIIQLGASLPELLAQLASQRESLLEEAGRLKEQAEILGNQAAAVRILSETLQPVLPVPAAKPAAKPTQKKKKKKGVAATEQAIPTTPRHDSIPPYRKAPTLHALSARIPGHLGCRSQTAAAKRMFRLHPETWMTTETVHALLNKHYGPTKPKSTSTLLSKLKQVGFLWAREVPIPGERAYKAYRLKESSAS